MCLRYDSATISLWLTPMNPNLILVDGSSYLYRAFHALPPLTNSKGQPTGAVYGVLNMLRKLMKDYSETSYFAVVFDSKGKTFRDDLFAQYKAHRPPMPDELQSQIEPLHAIIRAMGIPVIIVDGVEADDVIGTFALQAKHANLTTLISTGDKDMAQLVNEQITLINTMNNSFMDIDGVKTKFGLEPNQIVDYLALVGDTSDNIPGIPNVGPKTAVKWLSEYQTVANLVTHADKIMGKVGENLRTHLEQLPLAQQLATIKTDVELSVKCSDLTLQTPDQEALKHWYTQLEFKSWLTELLEKNPSIKNPEQKVNYEIIFSESDFNVWLEKLKKTPVFAFDTETTDLDYMQARIVGISFAIDSGHAAYIPLTHNYLGAPAQLNCEWVLQQLKPLLEDPNKLKIGHHLKYDKNVLANHQIDLQGIAYDTMLESYVFDSTGSRHNLDALALKYLGYKTVSFEEIAGKGVKQLTFNQIPIEQAGFYAAEDADITLKLHQMLYPQVAEQAGLNKIFSTIEIPLAPVLAKMEQYGVLIDPQLLKEQSKKIAEKLIILQEQAYKEAGQVFNLASPKQLQEILFTKLNLPVLEKTPTGQPSTGESVLQDLALNFELPKLILEHRSLSKLKSTYLDSLPEQINPNTGRIHTSYHQAVAATGRLSSTDPNLQNIPIRTEEGRHIRQAFIAPPGYKIVAADYSQIELRLMAHFSQDQDLLNAFKNNLDVHAITAAEIFSVPVEEVSFEQRRGAKVINFGLIYGMSAFGLAKQLGIERGAAQNYIDRYFARYPKIQTYIETTKQLAHKQGYVETILGRRLYLTEINTRNLQRQRAAERAAVNAPLQGTAADIIKIAMINIDAALSKSSLDARMIMQVHDELVFEVAETDLDPMLKLIEDKMTHVLNLEVPLLVDIGVGSNWDEAH